MATTLEQAQGILIAAQLARERTIQAQAKNFQRIGSYLGITNKERYGLFSTAFQTHLKGILRGDRELCGEPIEDPLENIRRFFEGLIDISYPPQNTKKRNMNITLLPSAYLVADQRFRFATADIQYGNMSKPVAYSLFEVSTRSHRASVIFELIERRSMITYLSPSSEFQEFVECLLTSQMILEPSPEENRIN